MLKQKGTSGKIFCRVTDYAERVLSGEIVAGPYVRNACKRHLHDLEHAHERGYYFSYEAAERAYGFFEDLLKLSDSQFDGVPFKLHESQSFIVGSIFGWLKKSTNTRRFERCYVEQGKGNGKSPLAGGIGLIGLCADGEAGAQVFSVAAQKDQAAILFRDATKMVRQSPALVKRIAISGGLGKEYNLAYHKTGSFFRPMSKDVGKTGAGLRPHFILADEIHEMPDGSAIESLVRGFKGRTQPLVFMITNSGSSRESVAWMERVFAIKCAGMNNNAETDPSFLGESPELWDKTFAYVCALDEGDDPLNDESCWIKANPLLGIINPYERMRDNVNEAKQMPHKQNEILRLHFCVWTDADVAWMSREKVEPLMQDFEVPKSGQVCIGLDLSQNRDITAMGVVMRTGDVECVIKDKDGKEVKVKKPTFDAWIEAWTPGDTVEARSGKGGMPFLNSWVKQGFIHAPPGENISFRHVAQTLAEYHHNYDVKMVAYDRYAYRRLEEEVDNIGFKANFVEHPQGGTKKGKPTDEMIKAAELAKKVPEGLWFPSSLRMLEDAMLEGRIRFKKNPVLITAIMSAVIEQDKWDNKWLSKQKSVNKIDAIVALVMAFGAANAMLHEAPKFKVMFIGR